ncbi:hypothetical protein ABUL04_07695 [Micromonospora harpali]|uniref:SWIM-type domain-containing protein n=1 Tax=Micromonospora harpali TaxID=1490225 RepID=A0ABW1HLG2_9ACTN
MPRRVSYKEYLLATALTLVCRHKPVRSWVRWRYVCACGNELPCRHRHRLPISHRHWPHGPEPEEGAGDRVADRSGDDGAGGGAGGKP